MIDILFNNILFLTDFDLIFLLGFSLFLAIIYLILYIIKN